MRIKKDFVLRKVADVYVVVPVNSLTLDFNGIISRNWSTSCLKNTRSSPKKPPRISTFF